MENEKKEMPKNLLKTTMFLNAVCYKLIDIGLRPIKGIINGFVKENASDFFSDTEDIKNDIKNINNTVNNLYNPKSKTEELD